MELHKLLLRISETAIFLTNVSFKQKNNNNNKKTKRATTKTPNPICKWFFQICPCIKIVWSLRQIQDARFLFRLMILKHLGWGNLYFILI